jgi:thymidylate synthase (FAD)
MTEITCTSDITVRLVQKTGGDHMVVAAARVSTSGEEALTYADPARAEESVGLIRYLMKQRHGCYDSDTEVLTSAGWKRWPVVNGTEGFVTLNLLSDEIEVQQADRLVRKTISGPMVRLHMPNAIDALVTPDHNMVVAPRTRQGWVYGFHPARDLLDRSYRLRLGGGLWGGRLHAPEEAELVGFIAADGNVSDSITFHLTRPAKVEWLMARTQITVSGDRYRLNSCSDRLRRWAKETYTESGDRCFPREILEHGDAETVRALLDGYLAGDGSVSATGMVTCSTVSRHLVGDIQEAALKAGMAATEKKPDMFRVGAFGTRPLYRLTIFRDRNMEPRIGWTTEARQEEVSVVHYEGDIHCVTVPNGTLYVRRNGKPMWCGNTPFEHSCLTFFVHAPLFVWREWHRHRIGFSYNEESGRYKTLDPVFYVPPRNRPMIKVEGWKPGRPKFLECEDQGTYDRLVANLTESYALAYEDYEKNLALGVDPGLARDCLPVGIYSSCWVTCNPRSLMAFLSLRTHEPEAKFVSYPLYEIEVAARKVEKVFEESWPLTYRAFIECGRVGP